MRMMRVKYVLLIALLCVFSMTSWSEPVQVEAEGRAAGNLPDAREQALTDALREAVQQGAGIDVLGATKVKEYVLDYDRIFALSFGHVKSYAVLQSGLGGDNIYHVKIRATVDRGQPELQNALALRMIVHLRGSPRVALEMDELIEGLPPDSNFAGSWFEAAARDMQLQLVDLGRVAWHGDMLASRDEFFGDKQIAELRRLKFSQEADFIIHARLRGRYAGQESLYGMKPRHRFSLVADLKVLCPETGNVLASVPMAGCGDLESDLQSPEMAARDLVHKMLSGNLGSQYPGAWSLFRKMFAAWIVKMDLGAIRRLEFARITDVEFDSIRKALGDTPGITGVWPRDFDSKGLSFIDVESRLDAAGLRMAVVKAMGGALAFDRGTDNYLQFKRAGPGPGQELGIENQPLPRRNGSGEAGKSVAVAKAMAAKEAGPTVASYLEAGNILPIWVWGLISAGGALMGGGVYWLGKRGPGKVA